MVLISRDQSKEIPSDFISFKTYDLISKLKPFGMANPEPTFITKNLRVEALKIIGKDGIFPVYN